MIVFAHEVLPTRYGARYSLRAVDSRSIIKSSSGLETERLRGRVLAELFNLEGHLPDADGLAWRPAALFDTASRTSYVDYVPVTPEQAGKLFAADCSLEP